MKHFHQPSYIPQQFALLRLSELQKEHESIEFLYEKANQVLKNKNHKIIAGFKLVLAYKMLGFHNYGDAKKLIDESIEIYHKLGKEKGDRNLAFAHRVLGDWHAAQNQLNEAITNYMIAYDNYKSGLLQLKITEVSELDHKLVSALKRKNDVFSAKFFFQKHVDIFGADHKTSIELLQLVS